MLKKEDFYLLNSLILLHLIFLFGGVLLNEKPLYQKKREDMFSVFHPMLLE